MYLVTPMPDVGDIEFQHRRTYVAVNPDPATGPLTWRLAVPQEIGSGQGGGGGGLANYDFDGVAPIDVDMRANGVRTTVETSMNLRQLDDRKD